MRTNRFHLALALTMPLATAYAEQQPTFDTTTLTAGMHAIEAQVARTDEQRQYGLMFRDKLASNQGMLFIFPAPATVCMWMKNTLIPLSVAFLDEGGKIVNIEDMQPNTTDPHCSRKGKPIRYALEMNQGWFHQKNVKAGNHITGKEIVAK